MSTPIIGRNAKIEKDGVRIAFAKGVTVSCSADEIKDYSLNRVAPAVLVAGNQSYTFTIDRIYIDNTYADLYKAGTPFDLAFLPSGTTSIGSLKELLEDCVILKWQNKWDMGTIVLESVNGSAKTLTTGLYA